MKYLIASDIHGSAYYCEQVLEVFEKVKAERLILLGDLLYHGPRNELPKGYDPKAVTEMLNSRKSRILAVRGNCDSEVDQMVLEFPIMADYAWMRLSDVNFFMTHGHLFNDTESGKMPLIGSGDVLLHGHIHLPVAEQKSMSGGDRYYLLNPGSAALPKGGFAPSYGILEDREFSIFDFSGNRIKGISL